MVVEVINIRRQEDFNAEVKWLYPTTMMLRPTRECDKNWVCDTRSLISSRPRHLDVTKIFTLSQFRMSDSVDECSAKYIIVDIVISVHRRYTSRLFVELFSVLMQENKSTEDCRFFRYYTMSYLRPFSSSTKNIWQKLNDNNI